jgi:thioredoxin 1
MIAPIIEEIAEENPQYVVGKINVDDNPELAIEFGVSTIPNLVVMENGKVLNQIAGARPKASILKMLEE